MGSKVNGSINATDDSEDVKKEDSDKHLNHIGESEVNNVENSENCTNGIEDQSKGDQDTDIEKIQDVSTSTETNSNVEKVEVETEESVTFNDPLNESDQMECDNS